MVSVRYSVCVLISTVVLTGCLAAGNRPSPADTEIDVTTASTSAATHYYIDKLPDRTYVDIYGNPEHPRTWYTAAEALGQIGAPAIPALVERLGTSDPHELMLVLYALMLASQDPELLAASGGDYLKLQTVLVQETNHENHRLALEWWNRWCARPPENNPCAD